MKTVLFVFFVTLPLVLSVPNFCNTEACTTDANCSPGYCCENKCVLQKPEVNGGEACGPCAVCKDPFACIGGVCLLNTIGCSCNENITSSQCWTPLQFETCESSKCSARVLPGQACTVATDCFLTGCNNNICQGSVANGGACTNDFQCLANSACIGSVCAPTGTKALGAACTLSAECASPLGSPATCSGGVCKALYSVAAGQACTSDSLCLHGHACEGNVCVNKVGTTCTTDSDCGNGDCNGCSGANAVCTSGQEEPEIPRQCEHLYEEFKTAFSTYTGNVIEFLNSRAYINLACCFRCTEGAPSFLDFTGLIVSEEILAGFDLLNLDCDERTVSYVGTGKLCCGQTTLGDCASNVEGCAAFFASGDPFGLSQGATIGIAVGASVGGLLIIALFIGLCCHCCKKRKNNH